MSACFCSRYHRAILLGALLCLALVACDSLAKSKQVAATSLVPAGEWRGIKMRNLEQAALLSIQLETDGGLQLGVYSSEAYQQLPDASAVVSEAIMFSAQISVSIPSSGDYYLVLDNRSGQSDRQFSVNIKAEQAEKAATTHNAFMPVREAITRTFQIEELEILVVRCGTANAFAAPGRVYLCLEYIERLKTKADGDQRLLTDLLVFTTMHELGHVLSNEWGLPGQLNEEFTDEFAAVLMIMFDQHKGLAANADYFREMSDAAQTSPGHYPSHIRRSENLLRWQKDSNIARSWQPLLVPHIRDSVLEDLRSHPRPWSNSVAVDAELKARSSVQGATASKLN